MIRICSLLDSAAPVVARCRWDRDLDAEAVCPASPRRLCVISALRAMRPDRLTKSSSPRRPRLRDQLPGRVVATHRPTQSTTGPHADVLTDWQNRTASPRRLLARLFFHRTETPRHECNSGLVRRQSQIPRATVQSPAYRFGKKRCYVAVSISYWSTVHVRCLCCHCRYAVFEV